MLAAAIGVSSKEENISEYGTPKSSWNNWVISFSFRTRHLSCNTYKMNQISIDGIKLRHWAYVI